MPSYRVVFMGTPEFAVPSLATLAAMPEIELAGVVTQPDRPAGRGRRLTPPPVRAAAEELGAQLLQVATLRDPTVRERIIAWQPDAFVVAAFGLILSRKTLALPRVAAINVHASLLPSYRGASPIAAAIACGERETGVTLMRMAPGLDTGPVYAQRAVAIAADDTTGSLTARLARLGAEMLRVHLPAILGGDIAAQPQVGLATLTRPLNKADGWLDWSRPATEIERRVRAMSPWPQAWTTMPDGTRLQILSASVAPGAPDIDPGTIGVDRERVQVATGEGRLVITMAQAAGGRPVRGIELVHGRKLVEGSRLGVAGQPDEIRPLITVASE